MAGYYPKLKTDGISEKLLPELLLVHKVEARPWLAIPPRMCFHAKAQPQMPSFYPNMPSFLPELYRYLPELDVSMPSFYPNT